MPHFLLLVAVVSASPAALAGTPHSPELSDAVGDAQPTPANGWADLAGVWFAGDEETTTVNILLAAYDEAAGAEAVYLVLFDALAPDAPGPCHHYFVSFGGHVSQPLFRYGRADHCTGAILDEHQDGGGRVPSPADPVITIQVPRLYVEAFAREPLGNLSAVVASAAEIACVLVPATCIAVSPNDDRDHAETEATFVLLTGPERPAVSGSPPSTTLAMPGPSAVSFVAAGIGLVGALRFRHREHR